MTVENREPAILFIKPGAMKDHQKAKLTKAGVVCIEVDDPANVQFVRPSTALPVEELSHGELLAAAARAMLAFSGDYGRNFQAEFAKAISMAILTRHDNSAPQSQGGQDAG
jgi:hypothetical protein